MRYQFMWRRLYDDGRDNPHGRWYVKEIDADSDADAAKKMHEHGERMHNGHGVEFDHEMMRVDIPYDPTKHEATYWDMKAAGVELTLNWAWY